MLLIEEKERYEMEALSAKEKYHAAMVKYKKTENYQEYAAYLAEFKAKNATVSGEYIFPPSSFQYNNITLQQGSFINTN